MLSDTQQLVYNLYKDDAGNPISLSTGQDEIFSAIAKKISPRLHIMCHTRYGKTFSAGLAVLTRVVSYPEKWAIVAGTKEKAGLIMSVVNSHIFDNEFIKSRYMPDKGESIEELKRYRNKSHITFKISDNQFSEVFIGSAKEAMGFGCILEGNYVSTEKGNIEIKDLVKNKKAKKVYSFNHKKNNVELKDILEYQINPLGNREVLEIDLGDRKIQCTDDHPVWVEGKGYIKAKEVKPNDVVWVLD